MWPCDTVWRQVTQCIVIHVCAQEILDASWTSPNRFRTHLPSSLSFTLPQPFCLLSVLDDSNASRSLILTSGKCGPRGVRVSFCGSRVIPDGSRITNRLRLDRSSQVVSFRCGKNHCTRGPPKRDTWTAARHGHEIVLAIVRQPHVDETSMVYFDAKKHIDMIYARNSLALPGNCLRLLPSTGHGSIMFNKVQKHLACAGFWGCDRVNFGQVLWFQANPVS